MTESAPPPDPTPPTTPKRGPLGGLDPGWATVIAAVITIAGTVVTLFFQAGGGAAPAPTAPQTPVAATATNLPSGPQTTQPTSQPTAPASGQPTFTVVSALAAHLREPTVQAGDSVRTLSLQLPLLVRDEFETNDYGWALGTTDFADGISCTTTMASASLQVTVSSGRGPAYCYNGAPRNVRNFALVTELGIPAQRGADVGVLYGGTGQQVLVTINPQSQTLAVTTATSTLLPATFVDDIHPSGPNRVQLVVIESSVALFLADKLVLLSSNMPDPGTGPVCLYVRLNEANQRITLQSDRLELRGA